MTVLKVTRDRSPDTASPVASSSRHASSLHESESEIREETDEDNGLIYVNQGSFGIIRMYERQTYVFKTTLEQDHGDQLKKEFDFYVDAQLHSQDSKEIGGFRIPRVIELWRPSHGESQYSHPGMIFPSAPRADGRMYSTFLPVDISRSHRWASFPNPTFSMQLIPSLHPQIARTYASLFFTENLLLAKPRPRVDLLRLYFGRDDIPQQTTEVHPGIRSDFPLDIRRYGLLRDQLCRLGWNVPSVEEVSRGMGGVLARMHWAMGVNGRDAELVLGMTEDGELGCWAFDFNQCQRWLIPQALANMTSTPGCQVPGQEKNHPPGPTTDSYAHDTFCTGAERLATLIFSQELYYPRPHHGSAYTAFKDGYIDGFRDILDAIHDGSRSSWFGLGKQAEWDPYEAVRRFFGRYEMLGREKMERLERRRGMGKGVGSGLGE